jgi:hypothetical protein
VRGEERGNCRAPQGTRENSRRAKAKLDQKAPPTGKWWVDHAGRFANDPVFDEIVRLGREYRESLRPKQRKVKRDRP